MMNAPETANNVERQAEVSLLVGTQLGKAQ